MQSYSSEVTNYLMAASEGVIKLGVQNERAFEPVKGSLDGVKAWGKFRTIVRKDGVQRFDYKNIGGAWPGNDRSRLTMSQYMWDQLGDIYHDKVFNKETIVAIFEKWNDEIYRVIEHMSKLDGKDMKHLWWRHPENMNDLFHEGENVAKRIEPDCLGYWESVAIGKSIVSARVLYTVVDEITTVSTNTSQLRMSVTEAMDRYAKIVADDQFFKVEFRKSTPAKRMFLKDYKDNIDNEQCAEQIVCNARNRIFLHLKGAGGFLVSCAGRKFEISSRGDGSTGLYYREFTKDETYSELQSESEGSTVTTAFSIGWDMFSFSASEEIEKSKTYGWAITTESTQTEWKRIKEKSFLDGLAGGSNSMGRLVLFMNWYIGGLGEWFHTSRHFEYGSLMKEDPMPLESLRYLECFKIDSPFRRGEFLSVSVKTFGEGETWFHKHAGRDQKGVHHYTRANPDSNINLSGFTAGDCAAVLKLSPDELDERVS